MSAQPPTLTCGRCRRRIGARRPELAYRWDDVDYHRDCLINAQAEAGIIALVVTPVPPAATEE